MTESTTVFVNGVPQHIQLEQQATFRDVLDVLYQTFRSDDALISSLKVDGIELSDQDENAMGALPVNEIKSIEIVTTHPNQFIEETLQTLRIYAERLKDQCFETADAVEVQDMDRSMVNLLDGLQVMVDTLSHVKQILKLASDPKINLLETDLLSTLQDLLEARQRGEVEYVRTVIRTHLVECVQEWVDDGIPTLLKARDC